MKNVKKEAALVVGGILLGTALAAPVAGAALTAQQSSQKIVVDGQPAQIEAYSINGNNYCKLRDVGKAVGFHVSYDPLTNTVRINTNEAYEDAAAVTVKLPTGGSQYIPQVGDRILCDDGTEYEIKDVSRWNNNVYQAAKLPTLPAPKWSC